MRTITQYLCVFVALWIAPSLVGCNVDFDPPEEVHDLRVLAVRGEPPTVPLGAETVIDALVVTPNDDATTLSWELCEYTLSAEALRRCPKDAVLASGEGTTLAFPYTKAVAARVALLCDPTSESATQIPDDATLPQCGVQGFPATVRLVASGSGEEAVSVKTVYLQLPLGPGVSTETNQNPIISELSSVSAPISPGGTGTATCIVDETSIEQVTDADGGLAPEEIITHWYIASGRLMNDNGETIHFQADRGTNHVTLWCVAQDRRGGIDWKRWDVPL